MRSILIISTKHQSKMRPFPYAAALLWLAQQHVAVVVPLAFSSLKVPRCWRLYSAGSNPQQYKGIDHKAAACAVVSSTTVNETSPRGCVATAVFPHGRQPPFLALITEEDACDSDARTNATLNALQRAVSTNLVDLVSVRIRSVGEKTAENDVQPQKQDSYEQRLQRMVRQLVAWSEEESNNQFRVVVSSNWIEAGLYAGAHGVHFKQAHQHWIEPTRQFYRTLRRQHSNDGNHSVGVELLVGTSTHSVESAVAAWQRYGPDYFFAGTCFATPSHPEKIKTDLLEGPALPAQVAAALLDHQLHCSGAAVHDGNRPSVLAIGGLDATNCQAQVTTGSFVDGAKADGIATIRAVLCHPDPFIAVQTIKQSMLST
jgi:thiamine monophosphate synthase